MTDPIVVLISSYKEGRLIQGAIRSALTCDPEMVLIFDGMTEQGEIPGDETDIGQSWNSNQVIFRSHRDFPSESKKRTAMLHMAQDFLEGDFWILTLDADEALVFGEFLPDWIGVLEPGYPESGENVVPIKRTEAAWTPERGIHADIAPSRLIHSSIVKRWKVSTLVVQTPDNREVILSHVPAERMPLHGEPHILHRSFLRRNERAAIRAHKGEEAEWREQQIQAAVRRESGVENA